MLDVYLDGFFRDEQLFRDVAVPVSSGDLIEHLDFALRERFVAEMFGQPRRHLRWDSLLAGVHLADHLNQLLRRSILQEVPPGPGLEGTLNFYVSFEGGQHNNTRLRKLRTYCDQRINPAFVGKSEIH